MEISRVQRISFVFFLHNLEDKTLITDGIFMYIITLNHHNHDRVAGEGHCVAPVS